MLKLRGVMNLNVARDCGLFMGVCIEICRNHAILSIVSLIPLSVLVVQTTQSLQQLVHLSILLLLLIIQETLDNGSTNCDGPDNGIITIDSKPCNPIQPVQVRCVTAVCWGSIPKWFYFLFLKFILY
jgi:uncharacterized membrane protein